MTTTAAPSTLAVRHAPSAATLRRTAVLALGAGLGVAMAGAHAVAVPATALALALTVGMRSWHRP